MNNLKRPEYSQGPEQPKLSRYLFWIIIIIGIMLPWIVASGVKIYADAHGAATYPWSYFLSPLRIITLAPAAAWVAAPYFVFAFITIIIIRKPFAGLVTYIERFLMLLAGLAGGVIYSVIEYIDQFSPFDSYHFAMSVASIWYFTAQYILLGCIIGYLLVILLRRYIAEHLR